MGMSLIAFDTNHTKRYVFRTDKLKEIRGASSLLDSLNRIVMNERAKLYHAQEVYAHGGSGLFLVPTDQADAFGRDVQRAYQQKTGGGASITYATIPLPPDSIKEINDEDISDYLELLQWQLQEAKQHPPETLALPSHPFLRSCDACGIEYASPDSCRIERAANEVDQRYCESCQLKRDRDLKVKTLIEQPKTWGTASAKEYMWSEILSRIGNMGYKLQKDGKPLDRPDDFNMFRNFKGYKDYLGLIYADANNMGKAITKLHSLTERRSFAHKVDDALYKAVCTAIVQHLQVDDHLKPSEQWVYGLKQPVFPFDILLMGGDDICMVVPASVAMDVALTMTETFRDQMQQQLTLSVGVVLAPIKYPFGLLQEMAESSLKFAKQVGSDARRANETDQTIDDTRINFMIVTGSSSSNFKTVFNSVYYKQDKDKKQEFYATLRPYLPADLRKLLQTIRGKKDDPYLGRSKLHQLREAVLKLNLTTSVYDGLTVLKNWQVKPRNYVVHQVYESAARRQLPHSNPNDPISGFPRVTFPWFADGKNANDNFDIYRTPLLDFIELYDIIAYSKDDEFSEKGGEAHDDDRVY